MRPPPNTSCYRCLFLKYQAHHCVATVIVDEQALCLDCLNETACAHERVDRLPAPQPEPLDFCEVARINAIPRIDVVRKALWDKSRSPIKRRPRRGRGAKDFTQEERQEIINAPEGTDLRDMARHYGSTWTVLYGLRYNAPKKKGA